jgi:hypothetical protein
MIIYGGKNMKRTMRGGYLLMVILLFGTVAAIVGAEPISQTNLFLKLDTSWEHANPGDVFVARADVKNIGDTPALLIQVSLANVPHDWKVRPQNL